MESLLTQIFQITLLELMLAGDEAALIILACRGLRNWQEKIAGTLAGASASAAARIVFALSARTLPSIGPNRIYVELAAGALMLLFAIVILIRAPSTLRLAILTMIV